MGFRHEYKHIVSESDLCQLRSRLPAIFSRDKNCRSDGSYAVYSLYFDNPWDKALREKVDGVNLREKFRIRYYNSDPTDIRLEKKSKQNGMCRKESVVITRELCACILNGEWKILMDSNQPLLQELYAKMKTQCLRPRQIVVYRRESFVYPPGNVRITLDTHIVGSQDVRNFLHPKRLVLHGNHPPVLEVKWDRFLPGIVQSAVSLSSRRSTSFSKYAAVRF